MTDMNTRTLLAVTGLVLCQSTLFAEVRQVFRPERFTRGDEDVRRVQPIDEASWIWSDGAANWADAAYGVRPNHDRDVMPQTFLRFRRTFAATAEKLRFDVSADERFILFLDGQEIARGPHRCMPEHWFYQSYEADLAPGEHRLEAIVWQLGGHAPLAQLSWRGGFVLKAEGRYDKALTTGKADWQVAALAATRMTGQGTGRSWGVGSESLSTGTSFYAETPAESAYRKAVVVRGPVRDSACGLRLPGWMLFPTAIPDQLHARRAPGAFKAARHDAGKNDPFAAADATAPEVAAFNALLAGGRKLTVPARGSVRAIWDLGNYYCAYPELSVAGGKGAKIRWRWLESLVNDKGRKADRAAFAGKSLGTSFGDEFVCDGRADAFFTAPWWRCGRWCQIEVEAADEPVELTGLAFSETRYPAEPTAYFRCDDPTVADVMRICNRGLQMCTHEMFFDCPHFEQQMYPGDSRVQYLTTFAVHDDPRLVRQCITLYDEARRPNGLIPMNFPTRMTQESATYTMCWVDMFGDYLRWRGDDAWLRTRMPGMRHALDGLAAFLNADGLVGNMPGWSFTDYTLPWPNGLPPFGKKDGLSAMMSLQYLYALRTGAEVEAALGERHFAAHYAEAADALAKRIRERFWSDARGMLADTSDKDAFSEQAQCFAILADALTPDQKTAAFKGLVEATDLTPMTVYFSHYLFDTYFAMGRSDLFFRRIDLWRRYVKLNMSTLQESPESPSRDPRSDCHAWGAHPLYHLQAHVAGVKPASPHFGTVRIAPQPGPLTFIQSGTPTPKGLVELDLRFDGGRASGTVRLPQGLSGEFVWNGTATPVAPGLNRIR